MNNRLHEYDTTAISLNWSASVKSLENERRKQNPEIRNSTIHRRKWDDFWREEHYVMRVSVVYLFIAGRYQRTSSSRWSCIQIYVDSKPLTHVPVHHHCVSIQLPPDVASGWKKLTAHIATVVAGLSDARTMNSTTNYSLRIESRLCVS